MIRGVVAAALVGGAVCDSNVLINDHARIEALNSVEGSTWVAGHNPGFDFMTIRDARKLFGTVLVEKDHVNNTLPQAFYDSLGDAAAGFDARTQWGNLIHPIRNQQSCGSCWAFSAAETLGDRVAVALGKESPVLSPEDMVSCDTGDYGCNGGMLDTAWAYLKSTGIVTDACFPYTAGGGTAPACATSCADGSAWVKQKASSAYSITGVSNVQKELQTHGPVQTAFYVYSSFMSYSSGVYSKHWYEYSPEGGHAVKFMGWGTESSTDYWLVANSWGTSWGLDGYFKIKRGNNECRIESVGPPYAGLPAVAGVVV